MKRWRRFIQGAPLFLPLLAVVGAIGGGGGWGISAVAFLLAAAGRAWRVGLCALLCATAAGLHTRMRDERADAFRALAETEELVQLCGTVERELQRGCVLNTGWNGVRVVLRGSVPFRTGDLVQVRAIWREPLPASLPGVFDAVAWMQGQGIAASVDFVEGRKLGKPLSLRTLQSWGLYVRERLARRLMPPGTESDSSRQVLCALVLGDKGSAEFETMEGFRNGGCLHAFAVSGLHVGLVSGVLWCLLRMLRVRPVVIRPLLLVCVGAYVLMTGCAVPALRAYLMLVVLLAGYMLQRRVNLLNTWSFAALLILMVEPSQLYNAGFLLSFGVYAALCIGLRLCLADSPLVRPGFLHPSLVAHAVGNPLEPGRTGRAGGCHCLAERLAFFGPHHLVLFPHSQQLQFPDQYRHHSHTPGGDVVRPAEHLSGWCAFAGGGYGLACAEIGGYSPGGGCLVRSPAVRIPAGKPSGE